MYDSEEDVMDIVSELAQVALWLPWVALSAPAFARLDVLTAIFLPIT